MRLCRFSRRRISAILDFRDPIMYALKTQLQLTKLLSFQKIAFFHFGVKIQDGGWDFRGPVMGSLRSPCTTSYRSSIETIPLNCLLFEKIAFLHFGDRQTNGQTDGHNRCVKPQSRYRELRLNNYGPILHYFRDTSYGGPRLKIAIWFGTEFEPEWCLPRVKNV